LGEGEVWEAELAKPSLLHCSGLLVTLIVSPAIVTPPGDYLIILHRFLMDEMYPEDASPPWQRSRLAFTSESTRRLRCSANDAFSLLC
jgi:hypothetical protein